MELVAVLVLLPCSLVEIVSVTRDARDSASCFDHDFSTEMVVETVEGENLNMKTKSNKAEKSAAVLTIKDAAKMTTGGRRAVAAWLIRQAESLAKDGKEYDGTFRARYLYA